MNGSECAWACALLRYDFIGVRVWVGEYPEKQGDGVCARACVRIFKFIFPAHLNVFR